MLTVATIFPLAVAVLALGGTVVASFLGRAPGWSHYRWAMGITGAAAALALLAVPASVPELTAVVPLATRLELAVAFVYVYVSARFFRAEDGEHRLDGVVTAISLLGGAVAVVGLFTDVTVRGEVSEHTLPPWGVYTTPAAGPAAALAVALLLLALVALAGRALSNARRGGLARRSYAVAVVALVLSTALTLVTPTPSDQPVFAPM